MGFFEQARDSVSSGLQSAGNLAGSMLNSAGQSAQNNLTNSGAGQAFNQLGSFRYGVAGGFPALAQDFAGQQNNIDDAKKKEREAQERYNQSIQNVTQLGEAQRNISKDFDNARPEIRKGLLNSAQRSTRQTFLDSKQQAEGNLAGRGILRSGITQKNNAMLDAKRKSDVNQAQGNIDKQLDEASADMADQGNNSVLQAYGLSGDAQTQYLRSAMEAMQRRSNMYADTFNNLGQAGAQYYARSQG